MRDGFYSLSGSRRGAEAWARVFGVPRGAALQHLGGDEFAFVPDDELVDVVSPGGKVHETTTVGSLRERGVLGPQR